MTLDTASPVRRSGTARIVNVVRLHLVNGWTYFFTPWMIQGVALAISIVIALLIVSAVPGDARQDALDGMGYSWAVVSPLWYLVVVGVQAVSNTFPFALGFSVTRREFTVGTLVTFVLMSAIHATGWTILNVIERATDGFGAGFRYFTAMWFGGLDAPVVWLSWFVVQMLVFCVGWAFATVYARWRTFGTVVAFIVVAVAIVGIVAVAVLTDSVPRILAWFGTLDPVTIFAGLLIPTALAFLVGAVFLRIATPRS